METACLVHRTNYQECPACYRAERNALRARVAALETENERLRVGLRAERHRWNTTKPTDAPPACGGCGGPHPFDTTIPSPTWNRVIRAAGLPDYLCTTCIVRAFVAAGEGFTAELWGEDFNGVPIELRVRNRDAKNTDLRARVAALEAALKTALANALEHVEGCLYCGGDEDYVKEHGETSMEHRAECWYYMARAALARPTPTPEGEQG